MYIVNDALKLRRRVSFFFSFYILHPVKSILCTRTLERPILFYRHARESHPECNRIGVACKSSKIT